jgi:eukaryotic translation initiation factor 2C
MAANNSCQMVFFCVPKHDEIYYAVKYFGDIVYGVPTQCILDTNFMSTPRGYFQNILYKINAKLDGQNQVLSAPQRPDKFTRDVLTMIIGVDVTHPGTNPLANEKVISSIAASVASFDSDFSKYMATIAAQPMNTEIVGNFDHMFVKQLQFFYTKNGRQFPRSVILFRDGVSEGQFSQVIDNEIPLIGKAFRSVGAKEPKITVFVVQKRHHTRLMPLVPKFNDKGREIRNIPAGTVVDHTITNPLNREFHLCSHEGLLVLLFYYYNIITQLVINDCFDCIIFRALHVTPNTSAFAMTTNFPKTTNKSFRFTCATRTAGALNPYRFPHL